MSNFTELHCQLDTGSTIPASITIENGAIMIEVEGFTEKGMYNILVEQVEGKPRVVIWNDHEIEEPSDIIELMPLKETSAAIA